MLSHLYVLLLSWSHTRLRQGIRFANVFYIRIKTEVSVLERRMRTSQEVTELISKNLIQSRVQRNTMGCGTTDDKMYKQYTQF